MFFLNKPGAPNPVRDGVTPQFESIGRDPTIAPGFDLPPGSVVFYNGTWYWKFDTATTDWIATPWTSGGGGGSADWPIANAARYYAIDEDGGSDANAGYSDVSAADALAVAVATPDKLAEIIPADGNGRGLVVLVKTRAGGVDYSTALVLAGKNGYRYKLLRGTLDGANDAAERVICGAVSAHATATWTVAAGADASTWTVVEALPALNALEGYRVRWLTGALAGQVGMVYNQTAGAGGQVISQQPFTGTPAAGATFTIDRPGASFPKVTLETSADPPGPAWTVSGIRTTGASTFESFNFAGGSLLGSFLDVGAHDFSSFGSVIVASGYTAEDGAAVATGHGIRCVANYEVLRGVEVSISSCCYLRTTAPRGFIGIADCSVGDKGSTFGCVPKFTDCGISFELPALAVTGRNFNRFGNSGSFASKPTRVRNAAAGSGFYGSNMAVRDVDAAGIGALGIMFSGAGCAYAVDGVVGATGGAGPGLDFTRCRGSQVHLGLAIANTIAGTSDVLLAGSVAAAHADFTKTNVPDVNGNSIVGTAGRLVGAALLSANGTGGAVTPGYAVTLSTGGFVAADASAFNTARVDGVTLTSAAAAAPCYVALPGAGAVYVQAENVEDGETVYLSAAAGQFTATWPGAGTYAQMVGTWIDGTDGVSGHIVFQPQRRWLVVDEILSPTNTNVDDSSTFVIPDGHGADLDISLEEATTDIEYSPSAFTGQFSAQGYFRSTANLRENFVRLRNDTGAQRDWRVRVWV